MAALIAYARGYRHDGSSTEAHRLGHASADARVSTWDTDAVVELRPDGSGGFSLRDTHGRTVASIDWGAQTLPDADRIVRLRLPGQDEATR